jgi:hypothetical protein
VRTSLLPALKIRLEKKSSIWKQNILLHNKRNSLYNRDNSSKQLDRLLLMVFLSLILAMKSTLTFSMWINAFQLVPAGLKQIKMVTQHLLTLSVATTIQRLRASPNAVNLIELRMMMQPKE